jgi:hypothetical protein
VRARVAVSHSRVLVVGGVGKWKRVTRKRWSRRPREENCQLTRLRLRLRVTIRVPASLDEFTARVWPRRRTCRRSASALTSEASSSKPDTSLAQRTHDTFATSPLLAAVVWSALFHPDTRTAGTVSLSCFAHGRRTSTQTPLATTCIPTPSAGATTSAYQKVRRRHRKRQ